MSRNRAQYIALLAPIAVTLRVEGSFMFPSVLIAQGILETGGEVNAWNNLLGIKAMGSPTPFWDGRSVNTQTREVYNGVNDTNVRANWRVYDSVEDCLRDHALLINKSSIYKQTRNAPTATDQCVALYRDGYATDAPASVDGDPAYYEKLISIIKGSGLEAYDKESEELMATVSEQIATLNKAVADITFENNALKERVVNLEGKASCAVPDWAKASIDKAVAAKLIDTPQGGSYDFYRLVTILDRKGLI